MIRHSRLLALAGVGMLVLAACAPAATPTPVPVSTPATPTTTSRPGVTPAPVTTTPRPTPTPAPTSVPTPPAGPVYGGIIRTAQSGDPPGWDFHKLPGGADLMRDQSTMVFQYLFTIPNTPQTGCSMVVQPELAEGFKWVNDVTLEVTIRQGVKFHNKPPVNGRAVTTEDVVYSIDRLLKVQTRVRSVAEMIDSVKAKDARTVVITLKQPFADIPGMSLLAHFGGPYVIAREAGGAKESWEDPATSYIGTAAFVFEEYRPGVRASYRRNPDYWKPGLPYVDRVDWMIMPEGGTRASALRSGRLDLLIGYNTTLTMVKEVVATSPEIKAHSCGSYAGPYNYWRVDIPPLNDVRVRRALSMAIDREGINRGLLGGEGQIVALQPPEVSPLWLALKDIPPEIRKYVEYRPEEARKLLAEAGYAAPRSLKVTVVHTRAHPFYWLQWTEAVVSAWIELGVDVTTKWLEYADYSRTAMAGKYEHMTTTGGTGARGDIYSFFAAYLSTADFSQNRSHINNPELDRLISEFMVTVDKAKMAELARRIQLILIDQVYQIQSVVDPSITLRQPWVHNFGPQPNWYDNNTLLEIAWLKR